MNFPVRLGSRGINGSLGGIRAPKPRLRPAGRPCPYPPQTALWSPLGTLVRSNRLSLPRSPGCVYPPFLPGDASLALKNGPTPGLAPAGKFSSRIRILQFSTGKITTTREHSCQFGETSYRVVCFFGFLFLCGTNLGITAGSDSGASHPARSGLLRPFALLALFVRDL